MIYVTVGRNSAVVDVLATALKTERIVDEDRNRRWHGEQTRAKKILNHFQYVILWLSIGSNAPVPHVLKFRHFLPSSVKLNRVKNDKFRNEFDLVLPLVRQLQAKTTY